MSARKTTKKPVPPARISLAKQFAGQGSGVMLLTLLPFMFSGIIFEPWNSDALRDLSGRAPMIFLPAVTITLSAIVLLTALASRQYWLMVAVMSCAVLFLMGLSATGQLDQILLLQIDHMLPDIARNAQLAEARVAIITLLWVIYTLLGFLSFLVIAQMPTVSSGLFSLVLFTVFADMIVSVLFSGRTLLGPVFLAYFPSHISVLICLMLIMIFRFVIKFFQENKSTRHAVRMADRKYLKIVRRKTLLLWWPMFFLFASFTVLYSYLGQSYIHEPMIVYMDNFENQPNERVLDPTLPLPVPVVPHDTVEAAANDLIRRLAAGNVANFEVEVRSAIKGAGSDKRAIMRAVRRKMPTNFPGTRKEDCKWTDGDCHMRNIVRPMINRAYQTARRAIIAELRVQLDKLEDGADEMGQTAIAEYEKLVTTFADQTQRAIGYTATGLRYANWLALLYAIMILMKSYMIVFARVFYSQIGASPVQNVVGQKPIRRQAQITVRGSQHRLKKLSGKSGRYYVSFQTCGNNVVDKRRVPQPFKLVIKRLLSRNYAMCLVDLNDDPEISACDIIVDPPAQIVEWDLKPDDEIFVDMRTIVAFSDTCRLSSIISLNVGALIFGRAIYHSVSGPGQVFIRTSSAPLAGNVVGTGDLMQSSSLIAWRRNTEFLVKASLRVTDTFFSGHSIRKADPRVNAVIFDTGQSRRLGTGQGILYLTRAFLLPF